MSHLVTAKVLVRAAIVLVPPLVMFATALLATRVSAIARLLLWTMAMAAYGGFWLALSVVVGARARSASAAALILVGGWLVLVVLVPALLNLTVRLAYPVPSRIEFATRARAATRDAVLQGSRQLGSFLEDHPASGTGRAGMQQYALLQDIRDTEVARRMAPLLARHESQLAAQRLVVNRLRYLSPIVIMQLALTDIAGTGDERQARFLDRVTIFQSAWKAFYQPRILSVTALSTEEIAAAPSFAFDEESFAPLTRRVVPPLLALVAATILLYWWGWRTYLRYDVTGSSR